MSNSTNYHKEEIPIGWERKTINQLSERVGSGITPRGGSEIYVDQGIIFIRSQNVTFEGLDLSDVVFIDDKTHESMQASEIYPFDVLINITGASIGRCCFAPNGLGQANVNQHVCAIRLPNPNFTDAKFLSSVLSSPIGQNQIFRLNAGGNREGLNYQQLRSFEIPWPTLLERAKIAKILTTIDNLIEQTEALIAKYQAIKQGMMHDLFTRGVDAHGHLRPPYDEAPELYKESELGWIPREWDTDRVGNLGEVKLGRQRSPKYQLGINPRPYLRVVNVFDDRLDLRDVLSMDFSPEEFEKYRLEPGDVLLTEGDLVGPWNVGRSAVYRGEIDGCCFQNTLIRFRPQLQDASEYFHYAFCFLRSLGKFAQETMATTVFHLSAGRLKEIYTVLPPERERRAIAQTLLEQERVVDIQRKQHAKLLKLKAGLMQDLLTGNVRVRVDEPQETPA